MTTQEVAVVVGDGRLQDSKFCNIRESERETEGAREGERPPKKLQS